MAHEHTDIINLSLDIPVDFKAKDEYNLYCINLEFNVVNMFSRCDIGDGEVQYNHMATYGIAEVKGGLAYWNNCNCWSIMPQVVQEKYAEFVAENEILKD